MLYHTINPSSDPLSPDVKMNGRSQLEQSAIASQAHIWDKSGTREAFSDLIPLISLIHSTHCSTHCWTTTLPR